MIASPRIITVKRLKRFIKCVPMKLNTEKQFARRNVRKTSSPAATYQVTNTRLFPPFLNRNAMPRYTIEAMKFRETCKSMGSLCFLNWRMCQRMLPYSTARQKRETARMSAGYVSMRFRPKVVDVSLTHCSHRLDVLLVGFEVWRDDGESDHDSKVNSSSASL